MTSPGQIKIKISNICYHTSEYISLYNQICYIILPYMLCYTHKNLLSNSQTHHAITSNVLYYNPNYITI